MEHSKKDRDPEKARKRAGADLRCAARKLIPYLREIGKIKSAEALDYIVSDISDTLKNQREGK